MKWTFYLGHSKYFDWWWWWYTRCVIITGTPKFYGAKFSQYAVYLHRNYRAKARNNAVWSATTIVHHMYCLYRVTSLSTWRHSSLWTWPACYWYGSQTVAHPSARVSRRKADTLNTNSFACRTQLFVLVNDFNVYPRLLLIFVAVSVTELIFVQQCFIRFVQLVTLKVWWSIWHLLTCHWLLAFVYESRQFVTIYSKVIPQ